jgi:biotin transport system substrate-specific component
MITYTTYADILRPTSKPSGLLYDAVAIIVCSLLVTLSAQIAFYLPFSPVPITAQTFAVLLAGALLGSKRGSLSLLAYLAQGAVGLPVFAGGVGGMAVLLGPRGGYLVGFVLAAYVIGLLVERGWDRRVATTALAMLAGNAVIYLFGLAWLAYFVGPAQAAPLGLYPFIIGDILKLGLAAALLPSGWRVLYNTFPALLESKSI